MLVAKWIEKQRHFSPGTLLHGFQGSFFRTLRAAKAQGIRTVLEITLPPCMWEIVSAERRRLGLSPGRTAPPPIEIRELHETEYVVAQSLFSIRCLEKLGIEPGRIMHVPLGVDTERYRPQPT